jgi:hypothetical protein
MDSHMQLFKAKWLVTACAIISIPCLFAVAATKTDDERVAALPKSTLGAKATIGIWRFNDGKGNVAKDESPAKSHATIQGNVQWSTDGAPPQGKRGGSLVVDGKTHAAAGKPQDLNTIKKHVTLAAWIKRTAEPKRYGCVLSRQIASGGGEHYGLYFKAGKLGFMFNMHKKGGGAIWTKDKLALNEWIHIAAVADGEKIRLYVDGKQMVEKAWSGEFGSDYTQLVLAGNANGPKNAVKEYFTGLLDNVGIYNHALGADKIADLASTAK